MGGRKIWWNKPRSIDHAHNFTHQKGFSYQIFELEDSGLPQHGILTISARKTTTRANKPQMFGKRLFPLYPDDLWDTLLCKVNPTTLPLFFNSLFHNPFAEFCFIIFMQKCTSSIAIWITEFCMLSPQCKQPKHYFMLHSDVWTKAFNRLHNLRLFF